MVITLVSGCKKAGPALLIVLSLTGLAFIAEQPFGAYRKVDAFWGLVLSDWIGFLAYSSYFDRNHGFHLDSWGLEALRLPLRFAPNQAQSLSAPLSIHDSVS
jgi:hypothetical protein